jgi:coatomer protein complex subunit gamma
MSSVEATEVFFGVTKLFMSDDASLRRMVYLFIKDVAETCNPDDVIIVTSCLTKDMTCDVDLYRGNALRVLVRIVDVAMLGAIERYVKQAIVDSSGQVSSSALVSASHLFSSSPECAAVVRRWISETQEATSSPHEMVQYHAMQLLYQIKSHDKLGISKLVSQFSTRNTLRSPLALVLLVRYTAKLLSDEFSEGRNMGDSAVSKQGYQFLEASLRHKSELVVYEAARAICSLDGIEPQDLSPAISVLQLFLSSPKPATRYAAMRTLAIVANTQPRVVSKCNEDLEALIADSNRSIATLAITTLLKTGSENSIDRLLKQISAFLTEIADEFKITVVKSLQKLCLTYPAKHRVLVGFMSNFLREEGGFEFKKSIVASIISLIRQVPETTESSLLHLCEFIEDCEFTRLSTQILHLLGELGPTTTAPARYIRFIYNRVILENAAVRAAAVTALSKFAAQCPSLRSSIMTF